MTVLLGVGLIGVGWMGRLHARAYRAVAEHYPELGARPRLVIAADPVRANADDAVQLLGFQEATLDYREVLAHPEVDVVSICSPNFLHREFALAAAAAGKPFWIEKPMGRGVGDSADIAQAAAGLISCVGFNYRHAPAVEHLRKLVLNDRLGKVINVRVALFADYSAGPAGPRSWRYVRDLAGSGVLGDLMSHGIDLAQYVAGRITGVSALTSTVIAQRPAQSDTSASHFGGKGTAELQPVENEDYAAIHARFESGAIATFESSRVAIGSRCDYSLEVYGTEGAARWNLQRLNELQVCLGSDGTEYGYTTVYASPGHGDFARFQPGGGIGMGFDDLKTIEAGQFLESVVRRHQIAPSVADGLAAAKVLDAAERSAASGCWVEVSGSSDRSMGRSSH